MLRPQNNVTSQYGLDRRPRTAEFRIRGRSRYVIGLYLPTTPPRWTGLSISLLESSRAKEAACIYIQEACVLSIPSHSPRIMDETTRGFLAQAIRDAFTSSGIDHNEEYIDCLISKVDNDGTLDTRPA